MPTVLLAPQVLLYDAGSPAPSVEPGVLALAQNDSRAFGDGSHPTTGLCAGVVDLICRQRQPEAVLDVGTGTGVLARIARARGAAFVAATDVDAEALRAARTNVALDVHPVDILVSDDPPDRWGARFDLVVANILEEVLRALAPALAAALAPGGALVLSGFTRPQAPGVRVAFEAQGLTYETQSVAGEWVLLTLRR